MGRKWTTGDLNRFRTRPEPRINLLLPSGFVLKSFRPDPFGGAVRFHIHEAIEKKYRQANAVKSVEMRNSPEVIGPPCGLTHIVLQYG